MEILIILFIIFSLFIGSFLNVVALRIPKGESIVYPPSHCPSCNQRLKPWDLFPVFSYIFLKGKCRYCRRPISVLYPLGEIWTAVLFFFAFDRFGFDKELWIALPFLAILSVITVSDLKYQIISNKVVYSGMILFLILRFFIRPLPYIDYILGFFIAGGLLFLIAVITRGGMGGGDIKLMAMIGLVMGWKMALLSFFIASFIGGMIGVMLLLTGTVKRKEPIPFGPFIAIGTAVTYLWGEALLDYYFNIYSLF
ncbi:prepilin peptidase [Microaerobacter geothermalis]|uniref:prepilin peptidase n=1 Tax=Microaerobacter geothermalis TaxID=674972 RepID=UPI001F166AF1|nr:A24 family peptidase [Microaerobacter geothermalis]MCF6092699.1 prepilin peptidase [Microaerobacter geothermalis]